MANSSINQTGPEQNSIQLMDVIRFCLANWYWFVISVFAVCSIGIYFILSTQPSYTRSAEVLIKSQKSGNAISSAATEFSDMGLFATRTNVFNEKISFESLDYMEEVVKRLQLPMNYESEGRFHNDVLYGSNLPVTVFMENVPEEASASFTLKLCKAGGLELSQFVNGAEKHGAKDAVITGTMMEPIETPIGSVTVRPTSSYDENTELVIFVSHSRLSSAISKYAGKLTVSLNDKQADVLTLSVTDTSPQRAEDLLNTLITVYNEGWVADKNVITTSTSMFINERLSVIETELSNVDNDISSYKSANLLPDLKTASSLYLSQNTEAKGKIMDVDNQLYIAKYLRDYVTNTTSNSQMLPSSSGISNASLESLLKEYNAAVLERNNLLQNTNSSNPLIVSMDESLTQMRQTVATSIDNHILSLSSQKSSLQANQKQTQNQIAQNPNQAKYLLSVERQQSVKEALYLYLLQKREENELSQAFTAYNTKIVSAPRGPRLPVAPNKMQIMLICFILGLCIPLAVFYAMETLDTKVRTKKDIESTLIPFAGEIPVVGSRFKLEKYLKNKETKKEETLSVVVKPGKRDIVNESFRVIRTNLEFIKPKTEEGVAPVIMLTSLNPGSGKSFTTVNTALSYAIKGLNVLVIDGDLRHASTSGFVGSPKFGISDYLKDEKNTLDSVLYQNDDCKSLHVIPVGAIPPNPTELLENDRFKYLVAEARRRFDLILIDCPPINMMADAQIIEKESDMTIFIVRAGLFDKSLLPELKLLYQENKLKNMCLVLNGVKTSNGKYGYGYGYGYHYQSYYGSDAEEPAKA